MRGTVAKRLRREAHIRYMAIKEEYRPAYSLRAIYQAVKKEYKDEKRG